MLKHLKANYPEFMNILQPLVGVRPKKINLYQLKYLIEELYSVKFMIDTATIKSKSYVNESNNINKNVLLEEMKLYQHYLPENGIIMFSGFFICIHLGFYKIETFKTLGF